MRGFRDHGILARAPSLTLAYLLAGSRLGTMAMFGSVVLYGVAVFAIPAIMAAAVGDYLGKARAAAAFSMITFCFAIGQTLEEAYHWVSALEEVSDIILEHKLLGEEMIEYRKHSESYKKW